MVSNPLIWGLVMACFEDTSLQSLRGLSHVSHFSLLSIQCLNCFLPVKKKNKTWEIAQCKQYSF